MKPRKEPWGNAFDFEDEDEAIMLSFDSDDDEAVEFLEEAHEAINRLYQKTNKRGRLMKQPRRAESWQ